MLLAGGGRYDELTRLIGGEQETPAVGFAYYLDQIARAVLTPLEAERVLPISFAPNKAAEAVQWAQVLRRNGIAAVIIPLADDDEETITGDC